RSAYIALLNENPSAIDRLITLVSASEWITQQIISFPILLDELLRPVIIYHVFELETLRYELDESMKWIEENDLEAQMEQLRQFRLANVLRLAASEITATEEIHYIPESLSVVAQVILEKVHD